MSSPCLLEPRLQRRYQKLVQEHWAVTDPAAAGLRALPDASQAFASTQAAWRFYRNPRVSLEQARTAVAQECDVYVLVVHDWSSLHYKRHASKKDRIALTQKTDPGYRLQTALAVSDRDGAPLAPVFQGLEGADGVHSSQSGMVEPPLSTVDGLAPVMAFVEQLAWDKPRVHIIDAEADSVGHFRHWDREGYRFVVRADEVNTVRHAGVRRSLQEVRQKLWQQDTAEAVARRLLVASMACVLVWKLARSAAPQAEVVRSFLVRLSGRQMPHGRTFTEPALLAGLWVYLAMTSAREHYDLAQMQDFLATLFPHPRPPDSS